MSGNAAGGRRVAWDPDQYHRYSDHRLRPALELLARIDHPSPRLVHDLGCGGGEISRLMAERWPDAAVVGSDSSQAMLDKAAAVSSRVSWEQVDVRTWAPERPLDVIYSNAMLQWVDGHREIFPRLFGSLAPGGVLAVQMPLSWGEPSHRLMRETLEEGGFGSPELRRAVARKWVADAHEYYDLLRPLAEALDIWETRYHQVLTGDDPVLEWVKGTALRPVLEGLAPDELQRFLDLYRARLAEAYPRRPRGETLYPFPRLFIVARAKN